MRISLLATLPLLGALAVAPHQASAQASVTLRLGTPLVVTNYAQESYGDWHTTYRHWSPVTVYSYNGNWYPRQVRGSRAVTVYRTNNQYFLPPRDQDWNNRDHRISARRRPTDDDYSHAAPPPPHQDGQGRGRPAPPPRSRPGGGQ